MNPTGQSEALLDRYGQWLQSMVANFVSALDAVELHELAAEVRKEAAGHKVALEQAQLR